MSINKKDSCVDAHEMIARQLTHVKRVVGKSFEIETIEDMPSNNLRDTHEMRQSLTKDETTHIVKECSTLKTSTSTTTNPSSANVASASACKSLIRNKPTSPSSNTKLGSQNKQGNEDSNDYGLVDARDDDEEQKILLYQKIIQSG